MSGLAEIIKSGKAPGVILGAPDPQSVDVAVPKAIRAVFDTTYRHQRGQRPIRTEEVYRAIGYDDRTLKNTWKNL
jgi:hypothetical protein